MTEDYKNEYLGNKLRPMSEALTDREILAWSKDGGNFHQVRWNDRKKRWGMRWNAQYSQHTGEYLGWVPMPILELSIK